MKDVEHMRVTEGLQVKQHEIEKGLGKPLNSIVEREPAALPSALRRVYVRAL